MNLVYVSNNRPVTDSLTIAECFGKTHDNVMRDIRISLEKLITAGEGDFSVLNFEESDYDNGRGKTYRKFVMTEDAFALIVMAYTTVEAMKFKVSFINAFRDAKNDLNKTELTAILPKNYKEALHALINQVDVIEKLEEEKQLQNQIIRLQEPKVALYDTAMNAGNNFTVMHVAKTLGIGRNKLFDFLRDKKVLMKNNLPYESYVTRGYFEVRQYTITHFTTGLENKTQTLVTPKGMAWIHNLLVGEKEAN